MTGELSLPGLARDVLADLHDRFGMRQWALTKMVDGQSMVLVCVGDGPIAEGDRSPWTGSVEAIIAAGGQGVVGDVTGLPHATAASPMPALTSIAGVTVRDGSGAVWGTVMGMSPSAEDLDPQAMALPLSIASRSLSLVACGGAAAEGAPSVRRDLRRDEMTGLPDDRGWLQALTVEDERCRRYGNRGSVALILVDGFEESDDDTTADVPTDVLVRQAADALRAWRRGADHIARVGDRVFGVLLVEVWEEQAVAAVERLRETFAARRISVRLGLADNSSRSLVEAAEVAMELGRTA